MVSAIKDTFRVIASKKRSLEGYGRYFHILSHLWLEESRSRGGRGRLLGHRRGASQRKLLPLPSWTPKELDIVEGYDDGVGDPSAKSDELSCTVPWKSLLWKNSYSGLYFCHKNISDDDRLNICISWTHHWKSQRHYLLWIYVFIGFFALILIFL